MEAFQPPRYTGRLEVYPWAKSVVFPAGQIRQQHLQLGGNPAEVGTSREIRHGCLRVGFLGDQQSDVNFSGTVILPDNGTQIGPLDLPFELTAELPLRVEIKPDEAPTADRDVVASVSWPGAAKLRWGATRRILVPEGPAYVGIPQWVHSISVCEVDVAVTMFDALGNVLCAVTGPIWDVARPRLAVIMSTTNPGGTPVLCSYQA